MVRRILGPSAAVVLLVALFTVADAGVGGASKAIGTGSGTCRGLTGTGKVHGALSENAQPGTQRYEAVYVNAASSDCTFDATVGSSSTPVTITGVSVRAKAYVINPGSGALASCADFNSVEVLKELVVHLTWTASPPIAPSVVTLGGPATAPFVSGGPDDTFALTGPGNTFFDGK